MPTRLVVYDALEVDTVTVEVALRLPVRSERRAGAAWAAATSARGLKTTPAVRRPVPGVPAVPVYSGQGEACGSSFRQCAPTWFRGVVDAEWCSGGFALDRAELTRLVTTTPQAEVVASVVNTPFRLTPLTGAELARLVDQCQLEQVHVEEQDYRHYIIHVSDDDADFIWVLVRPESPLHPLLRASHVEWKRQMADLRRARSGTPQPEATSTVTAMPETRLSRFVFGCIGAGVVGLLGWLLYWLGMFGQRPHPR